MDQVDNLINELARDVKYQATVRTLLTELNQAKQRQDISQYKHLYRQLLNQEVDIYTVPYSSTRLMPPHRNKDNDAEFWFNYKGE